MPFKLLPGCMQKWEGCRTFTSRITTLDQTFLWVVSSALSCFPEVGILPHSSCCFTLCESCYWNTACIQKFNLSNSEQSFRRSDVWVGLERCRELHEVKKTGEGKGKFQLNWSTWKIKVSPWDNTEYIKRKNLFHFLKWRVNFDDSWGYRYKSKPIDLKCYFEFQLIQTRWT
jgi:hypothetical protein